MTKFFRSCSKFLLCITAVCAMLLCGCRSDRTYQNRAAERARSFLLENAPELTPQQVSFVKYNDPFFMTGDGLSGKSTGIMQICVAWNIPDADTLYMVFGVSRERMDDWYPNRIINIHPSLIPSFCGVGYYGLKVHEKALERGVKVTGATVHFVTEGMDEGPIIAQKAVEVLPGDTPEILQRRVMEQAEWKILPAAVEKVSKQLIG